MVGGVLLDDTTVEQSLEHLIVTRWRTSDRPAHAGNALPTDFVQTSRPSNTSIVRTVLTFLKCGGTSHFFAILIAVQF